MNAFDKLLNASAPNARQPGGQTYNRIHAVAANAVQAAREALGRGDLPATDDDIARQFAIADLLWLADVSDAEREQESKLLVAPRQAAPNPKVTSALAAVREIAPALDKIPA